MPDLVPGELRIDYMQSEFARMIYSVFFVTHEHIDHIRSAGVLSRRYKLPIFATEGTLNQGKRILGKLQNVILIKPGDRIPTRDIVVSPFSVSHDAADPVAYVMASDQTRVGICTDLGFSTYLVKRKNSRL